MSLEELLNAIEMLDVADLVPVLETITAKFAENFWYVDSYATPMEEEVPAEEVPAEEVPAEEIPAEIPSEEIPAEEDLRVSL